MFIKEGSRLLLPLLSAILSYTGFVLTLVNSWTGTVIPPPSFVSQEDADRSRGKQGRKEVSCTKSLAFYSGREALPRAFYLHLIDHV